MGGESDGEGVLCGDEGGGGGRGGGAAVLRCGVRWRWGILDLGAVATCNGDENVFRSLTSPSYPSTSYRYPEPACSAFGALVKKLSARLCSCWLWGVVA